MEDFGFSSENNLLKNIGESCWHVKNNNNNLLDGNSSTTQGSFHGELLPDELNTQGKQRESATATKASLGGSSNSSSSGLGVIGCSGDSGRGTYSGDGGYLLAKGGKQKITLMNTTTTTTTATTTTATTTSSSAAAALTSVTTSETSGGASITPTYVCRIEDEGGGADGTFVGVGLVEQTDKHQQYQNGAATPASCYSQQQQQQQQQSVVAAVTTTTPIAAATAMSNMIRLPSLSCDLDLESYGGMAAAAAAAAASLSPTEAGAAMAMAAGIGSNRTSINNSTENLSYSSDNYYPDDLILLDDDDDDGEAEEISLNSDDCVYAYRGDGADFELAALDANLGRGGLAMDGIVGGMGIVDDETEFLEMDFEPDPLSEAEFANISGAGGGCGSSVDHADLFLMQRDFSQLSGRHSANMSLQVTPTQRQHFSSPIDDLPPQEALQSQAQRLNKNFARISLHLDQIKGDSSADDGNDLDDSRCDSLRSKRLCSNDCLDKLGQTAHSLPNTLYTSFEREHSMAPVVTTATSSSLSTASASEQIPSKVTGAKPKRLSTFSSSSMSSKNSSLKSRNSLRSAFAPHASSQQYGNSASFDERSVSCTDFRSSGGSGGILGSSSVDASDCTPMLAAAAAAVVAAAATAAANACNFDLSTNDEPCLDCLEKEFLANTIGKAIDLSGCPKCAHKRSSSISLYTQAHEQTRCRSGSPSYFMELRDECLFNASNMPTPRKRNTEWSIPTATMTRPWDHHGGVGASSGGFGGNAGSDNSSNFLTSSDSGGSGSRLTAENNQRVSNTTTMSDKRSDVQLFPQNFVEPLIVQSHLTTTDMSESSLLAALDKLEIKYNADLIHVYFQQPPLPIGNHKNLKEFILYAAKQPNNQRKIEKLIDLATQHEISVEFKPDTIDDNEENKALVPVNVSDILEIWERNKDLIQLQKLDERFHDANIFGKIANIVRQARQRLDSSPGSSKRSPLPDFIMIPQYYPHGEFILRRKS